MTHFFASTLGHFGRQLIRNLGILGLVFALAACQALPQRADRVGNVPDDPKDRSEEAEIFYQSVAAGALIGGVAGAVIGRKMSDDGKGTLLGTVIGSAIGSAVANEYAKKKISEFRDVRLKNKQLETLVSQARKYNDEVRAYNASLDAEIASLRKMNKADRERLAIAKLKVVKEKKTEIAARIEEREQIKNALVEDQQLKMARHLEGLRRQEKELDLKIARYEKLAGSGAIIG
uniref:Glycine zipper 2TM domain-containing protein n=1 Tax=Candidatus Kentrum sp. SD TaxID=2126332 RepID=A0A450YBI8_9GAMM|nr:MAG: Glycine zipper 2TM domain-containing protein [Candidatus Kentron sp. SD]VFK43202.1 MAG: Glycine zipper 2TM domain-containing protein [Candidatus Kentron sp. SD]VFK78977.1 MAG: Glycine zipper 2TM domain-containing protein [Candidatus Kentron sp. SD]